jgi:hypothetical protein
MMVLAAVQSRRAPALTNTCHDARRRLGVQNAKFSQPLNSSAVRSIHIIRARAHTHTHAHEEQSQAVESQEQSQAVESLQAQTQCQMCPGLPFTRYETEHPNNHKYPVR